MAGGGPAGSSQDIVENIGSPIELPGRAFAAGLSARSATDPTPGVRSESARRSGLGWLIIPPPATIHDVMAQAGF
jgi:hypothetical protein